MKHIITIEGIGTYKKPHPAQKVVAQSHGSQCGFCTPGIVMSLYSLLKNDPHPNAHDIEDAFDGNLCRCTGYRPILQGAQSFSNQTKIQRSKCQKECSKVSCNPSNRGDKLCNNHSHDIEDLSCSQSSTSDSTTDVPIPKDMRDIYESKDQLFSISSSYLFANGISSWYHPKSLDDLVAVMDRYPNARIVHGNTEVGIEIKLKNCNYPVLVSSVDVPELKRTQILDDGIEFGASITISSIQKLLKQFCREFDASKVRGCIALLDNTKYFAGHQIRNIACIGGNIATASPISDLNPVFVALGAILTVRSRKGGSRKIPMAEFFLGYRKTALNPSEVIVSIFVPFTKPMEFITSFKQSKRKDDDIAIVNGAFRVILVKETQKILIKFASFAYGGMGPTTMLAKNASKAMVGKEWSMNSFDEISEYILQDLPLNVSSPGGQIQYRKLLALSFLKKFHLRITEELRKCLGILVSPISDGERSALVDIERPLSSGNQEFVPAQPGDIVGEQMMHLSATKQTTGEAEYVDDIPMIANELYAALVLSKYGHAYIKSVDPSSALAQPGVKAYVSAKDIPGWKPDEEHNRNVIGPVFKDEELFATDEVHYHGQLIGIIVGETQSCAVNAAKLVKVEYESLPLIVTIEDAIEHNSFFPYKRSIQKGVYAPEPDNRVPLSMATHTIFGVARMSAQEHFYLETQCSLVIPKKEDDEIEIFASTQNPTETQHMVAHILNVPSNRVNCRVKRMGGGFGGKETRSVPLTLALAVAAKKLGVPVRCMLTREEDMAISGQRHPFRGDYKVGFTDEGKLVFLELNIWSNGGFSMDLSLAVLERAITHSDNCYRIPNVNIQGRICKTNLPSNTA